MWKIHESRLQAVAKSAKAQELYEILEATFGKDGHKLPHSLRQAQPFVLCRDFCRSRHAHVNDGPSELYRFQLGPRVWAKPIFVYNGHEISDDIPRYEQEAEAFAKQLKLAKWEKVASALVDPAGAASSESDPNKIEVTLCWQNDGRYCVIHDREQKLAIALLWGSDGLSLLGEVHPGRLSRSEYASSFQAYDQPIVSLEDGTRKIEPAERAGKMEEFVAAVQWRYGTHLDHRLDGLLLEVCDRLRPIEGRIGMAFAGHRFNDAVGDGSWLAVHHENFAWENGSYFRSSAASLRSAPSEIHSLLGALVHLQTCRVSSAFHECYGYPVDGSDVIGLFRQSGKHYFACCDSQGSCGPVYEINANNGRTNLYGFTERFDWNFNAGSRAGGIIPQDNILKIVTLQEVVRRVETGDTPYDAGPPHGMDVPWMAYLPRDPNQ